MPFPHGTCPTRLTSAPQSLPLLCCETISYLLLLPSLIVPPWTSPLRTPSRSHFIPPSPLPQPLHSPGCQGQGRAAALRDLLPLQQRQPQGCRGSGADPGREQGGAEGAQRGSGVDPGEGRRIWGWNVWSGSALGQGGRGNSCEGGAGERPAASRPPRSSCTARCTCNVTVTVVYC